MQNKNFVDLTKNDATTSGNEKKNKKRARTIFGTGTKSVEKYNAEHGKKSWANQNFFLSENIDQKQKIIPKKTIKKHSSNKNCSPTNETDVETLEKLN